MEDRRAPRLLEAGAIRGRRNADLPARLVAIHDALREILDEFHPDAVALEDLFASYRFPRSALLMAHARGTICLAAAQAGVPVWSFAPAEVKNAIVGYGKASKEQVQDMVQRLFGLERRPRPHDVADALALALTGLHRASQPSGIGAVVLNHQDTKNTKKDWMEQPTTASRRLAAKDKGPAI